MKDSIIRVDYQKDQFLVTAVADPDYSEEKVLAGILQRFDNPADAIQYATAVMDGIQIYTKAGYFVPTKIDDVRITPEAAEKLVAYYTAAEKVKK